MKSLFLLFFVFFFTSNTTLVEVRKLYPNATSSEAKAQELFSKLTAITAESDKTLVAYKGASITLMSKFCKKIPEKISKFKEGVKWVEQAVTADPTNIEIRMIRLSIQENVPGIVNYKKNKKEDAAFIVEHYGEQTANLKEYIKNFCLQATTFNNQEKQTFK